MKFELSEMVVLASLEEMERKAEEAVVLAQSSHAHDSPTIRFECGKTAVLVSNRDTKESLISRWRIEHDFFGLPRRKRKMLYRACMEQGMHLEDAARRCEIPLNVAKTYALHKGWQRSTSEKVQRSA